MLLKQEIDDEAVKYIAEVQKRGGILHYGNDKIKDLIHTSQTLVKGYYNNEPNKWDKGRKLAWELGLMENIAVGEGCFFQVKISKKGNDVLSQLPS